MIQTGFQLPVSLTKEVNILDAVTLHIQRLRRGGRGGPSSSVNFIKIKSETFKKLSFLDETILNIFTYQIIY
jgi:hypothetical protein